MKSGTATRRAEKADKCDLPYEGRFLDLFRRGNKGLHVRHLSVCVLVSLAGACSRGGVGGAGRADAGPVVATVGEKAVTSHDFVTRLSEQPELVRARYSTLERKKEFLEGLIRQELLLQEARRRSLDQDPEVKAVIEKVIVQKLIQVHTAAATPAESDLRSYYDAHREEFVRPARVRASHYFVASPPSDPKHAAARGEVQKFCTRLKALSEPALSLAFREEVRKGSADVATKSVDGDLGLRTRDELVQVWGEAVADAAMALKVMGEVSAPIESEKGIHVLQLTARQPGVDTSFDDARPRLVARLQAEVRSKALDELVASLKKSTRVDINEEALRNVQIAGPDGPLIPPLADGG